MGAPALLLGLLIFPQALASGSGPGVTVIALPLLFVSWTLWRQDRKRDPLRDDRRYIKAVVKYLAERVAKLTI